VDYDPDENWSPASWVGAFANASTVAALERLVLANDGLLAL